MNFLERRRTRKMVRHLLHEARHAHHMREDVASAENLAALAASADALREAWAERAPPRVEEAADRLVEAVERVAPPRAAARFRENVEIFAVALAVAMAFRTYFVQPFKIPTGSMQPTLYGITVQPQMGKKWHDYFPLNLVALSLFGERYVEVRAKVAGAVDLRVDASEEAFRVYVAGVPHAIQRNMTLFVRPGESLVQAGQILAAGRVRLGDHIFVNKVRYNFSRPERGDIFVFSTKGIDYPRIRPDSFYIKRLAGLPGEDIAIDPPYLVADGQRITEPFPFHRLVHDLEGGYLGYQMPHADSSTPVVLGARDDHYHLPSTHYLPLGDNTRFSLDGRYFGGVDRQNIVGPAFAVYWPLSKRWGLVR